MSTDRPLLPCPFCGGEELTMLHVGDLSCVECESCRSRGQMHAVAAIAQGRWNRRALAPMKPMEPARFVPDGCPCVVCKRARDGTSAPAPGTHSGTPPVEFDLTIVVNGQPVATKARVGDLLRDLVGSAIRSSGQVGRPLEDWRVRSDEGEEFSVEGYKISKPFPPGVKLWAFLGLGKCASGAPTPGTPVGTSEEPPLTPASPETLRDLAVLTRKWPVELRPASAIPATPEEGRFRCVCPEKVNCPRCAWSCLYCRHERRAATPAKPIQGGG